MTLSSARRKHLSQAARVLLAASLVSALAVSSASAQSAASPAARRQQPAKSTAQPNELSRRIEAANAAQRSGNPATIATANQRLLSYLLHAMGRLRISEGAYPQAVALYRASLAFEPSPGIHSDLAIADQLAGNAKESLQQAKLAAADDPRDPHAYITLGRAYIAQKDYAAAARSLDEADRLHPDIGTLYLIAISWLSEGQPNSRQHADAIFDQMKQMARDSGSLHVLMGRAYRDAGLMPDAVKQFKRAIELNPATPHAHYFLGLASLSMNEWLPTPEAESEMEKELEYHPDDFLANYMLGFIESTEHKYADSDKHLQKAASLNSTWPEPYLYMGLNAFAQSDDKTAEAMLRKAVELTGSDESRSNYQIRRAYVDLGRILSREGHEKEADYFAGKARDLENKVMQQTQQSTTAMMLANGGKQGAMAAVVPLDEQENHASAIAEAAAGLNPATLANSTLTPAQRAAAAKEEATLRPILGQAYSDLATAQAIQHHYPAALVNYQAAEQWDPSISELYKNLGLAAYRAANYSEAARALAKAVQHNPDSPPLRAMLGMSYFQLQRYGDAATAFYPLGEAGMHDSTVGYAWAYSLQQDSDLKHASQVLAAYQSLPLPNAARLLVAQLWIQIGDYAQAVDAARQILAADPNFPRAHYTIAIADIHSQKWDDARTQLQAELAISPHDPDTLYNLGFLDLQQSRNADAARRFEQVIAAHPDYANAQYELGKLLLDGGKIDQALPHLEVAARLEPNQAYVHYQLQAAYRKLSRTADADRELALYQQITTKKRADAAAAINQTLHPQK